MATVPSGGTAADEGGTGFSDGEVSGVPDLRETPTRSIVFVLRGNMNESEVPNAKTSKIGMPAKMYF